MSVASRSGTTAHIEGAVHLPLHELGRRLPELPAGEVWVHCEGGYRASVAASLLDAAGRTVVAIDDEFHRAAPPACRSAGLWSRRPPSSPGPSAATPSGAGAAAGARHVRPGPSA